MTGRVRAGRLVGRDAELARLLARVDAARTGRGGLVLVSGEAGAGKSRLIGELAARAVGAGTGVLRGAAVEDGQPWRPVQEALLPAAVDPAVLGDARLRPFRAALAALLPDGVLRPAGSSAAAAVDAASASTVVLGAAVLQVAEVLGTAAPAQPARGSATLLLLEDLHWADTGTLQLVEYLAGAATTRPVLVLGSARSDEQPPQLLSRLGARGDVEQVRLGRLSDADAAAVARAALPAELAPDLLADVVSRAEGLPLLVEELLEEVVASTGTAVAGGPALSPTLRELVRRRSHAMTDDGRLVLAAAAVLGREPDWSLLPAVTGLDAGRADAGLRALLDGHLLEAAGRRLRWRHDALREAALADALPSELARVAGRAADALLAREGGRADRADREGGDTALAAALLARAGRDGEAAGRYLHLGRRAVDRGAVTAGIDLLARAERLGDGPQRGAATAARVEALALAGRADLALSAGRAALREATGPTFDALALSTARAALVARRWDEAKNLLGRRGGPPDAPGCTVAADAAFGAGDLATARAQAADAVARAERADDPRLLVDALDVLGRALLLTDPAGRAAFERAVTVAQRHGLRPAEVRALLGLATARMVDGDATDLLERARRLAEESSLLTTAASLDVLLAAELTSRDGPGMARPVAERARDLARTLGLRPLEATALALIALGAVDAGDLPAARALTGTALALAPDLPDLHAVAALVEGVDAVLDHDLPRARDLLDAGIERLAAHASSAPLEYWGLWVLVRTVLDDRVEQAWAGLRAAPAYATAMNRAGLRYAEAVVAGRRGAAAEAATAATEAARLLAPKPWWGRLLGLLALEQALADGWGDPVAELRAMLPVLGQAGPARTARTARDLLRAAGVSVPRARPGGSPVPDALRRAGVTAREMEVLTLVAQGRSSTEVAGRLFLSARTVDTHVASLLAKTGRSRRSELAALLDEVAGQAPDS